MKNAKEDCYYIWDGSGRHSEVMLGQKEEGEEVSDVHIWVRNILGRGNSTCKYLS